MIIDEIITVDVLEQPSEEQKKQKADLASTHYQDNLYYHRHGKNLLVVCKDDETVFGYVDCIAYQNAAFSQIPIFIVPHNLYSWANDHGKTALSLIKAVIHLANMPVLGDLELTPASKKFLKNQIAGGTLRARTFNLKNGDVTPYDTSIWTHDDNFRVLLLDQRFGTPISGSHQLMESTWNYLKLQDRLSSSLG
ncbi:hypothetical protein UFOVP29_20 [uncultured Caudovirales phage]|uniref:Uncharacterized protein n=1 Tax=uncultured Caudovirales phage TaxID=2100421 RepID=A0A6J5KMM0_9CAUD|nr:hypothetical protein UFOVP29_20 [uncultured Caudovirales phage]